MGIRKSVITTTITCVSLLGSAFSDTAPARVPEGNPEAPRCDAAAFAKADALNRASCRRQFARQGRPSVQISPQTIGDYAS